MGMQSLMAFFLAYVPESMGSRLVRLGRTIKTKAWGKPSKIPVLRTAVSLDITRTCQAAKEWPWDFLGAVFPGLVRLLPVYHSSFFASFRCATPL